MGVAILSPVTNLRLISSEEEETEMPAVIDTGYNLTMRNETMDLYLRPLIRRCLIAGEYSVSDSQT